MVTASIFISKFKTKLLLKGLIWEDINLSHNNLVVLSEWCDQHTDPDDPDVRVLLLIFNVQSLKLWLFFTCHSLFLNSWMQLITLKTMSISHSRTLKDPFVVWSPRKSTWVLSPVECLKYTGSMTGHTAAPANIPTLGKCCLLICEQSKYYSLGCPLVDVRWQLGLF